MIVRLLVSPSLEQRVGEMQKILTEHNFKNPHSDLLYFDKESKLGIAQAREIKDHFSLKPFEAKGRVVVIEDAENLTLDAQNALLKTLEEPPLNAILLLGIDKPDSLLPTVLSRCQVVFLGNEVTPESNQSDSGQVLRQAQDPERSRGARMTHDFEKLIESTIEQRFLYIEKLEDKEQFLQAITEYFHQKLQKDPKYLEFSKKLLVAQKWQKSNVNLKGILEYLMLELPSN